MTSARDQVVVMHDGTEIRLEATTGRFYARLKDGEVGDKTLDGVKRKLDNIRRASARKDAIAIAAVLFVPKSHYSWSDEDEGGDWYEGTFAGINAHTGEISFVVKGKREQFHSGYLFRAGDPAIAEVKTLQAAYVAAYRAEKDAQKKYEAAKKQHGHYPSTDSRRDKSAAAADAEERAVAFLGNTEQRP